MSNTRKFCQTSILRESEVLFDFDVSSITEENLNECIEKISGELFRQRPTTEPYVQASTHDVWILCSLEATR